MQSRGMALAALLLVAGGVGAASIDACLECHAEGRPESAPNLDGQNRPYLVNQLARFREHVRQSFPMDALAQGLDDQTIAALADRFSKRAWVNAGASPENAQAPEAGAAIARRHDCAACHGKEFRGGGDIPRLAGQQAAYLARQIGAFADGERFHPPTGAGSHMYRLDAVEADALGVWLNGMR